MKKYKTTAQIVTEVILSRKQKFTINQIKASIFRITGINLNRHSVSHCIHKLRREGLIEFAGHSDSKYTMAERIFRVKKG